MNDIIEALKNSPEYIGGSGRTDAEIETAEQQLGVRFATDYRHYLKEIGLASFDGHELTGLSKSARLNVVDVTVAQREWTPEASSWYLVPIQYLQKEPSSQIETKALRLLYIQTMPSNIP